MPDGKGLKGLGALMALGGGPSDPSQGGPAPAGGDGDEGAPAEPDGGSEMLVGAAHDVMSAIRGRDTEAFAAALKDFVSMC